MTRNPLKHRPKYILKRLLRCIAEPARLRKYMLMNSAAPLWKKADYDALDRPHYGYGVLQAARQAKALGIPKITVIEVGVGGGDGLKSLERIVDAVEREEGVKIDLYGFDTGTGMPPPRDPRDMGFVWAPGQFRMPVKRLKSELRRAMLVLGDVRETVPRFLYRNYPGPIGFIAIDVDYYTSTMHALKFLDATPQFLLPRVFLYLDDIIGDDLETHCEFVGELAAVSEFNRTHEQRKIGRIYGLRHKRIIPARWNDQMFVAHNFDHPLYGKYINPRWAVPPRPAAAPTPNAQPLPPSVVVRAGAEPAPGAAPASKA
ncbi:MAG TPA: hypothetical protein PL072_02365 [Phycisphaerales bacterium]|nr:hypothetical protein [Phycisphaerales bacterium]